MDIFDFIEPATTMADNIQKSYFFLLLAYDVGQRAICIEHCVMKKKAKVHNRLYNSFFFFLLCLFYSTD